MQMNYKLSVCLNRNAAIKKTHEQNIDIICLQVND